MAVWWLLTSAVAAWASAAAQPAQEPQAVEQPADPAHLNQLELCRAGLLDADARPVDRRRWADQLLTYNTPQARDLIVQILTTQGADPAQVALCEAIRDLAAVDTVELDPRCGDALLALLASSDETLRTRAAQTLGGMPFEHLPQKLGAIARDVDKPLAQRLAAIDALAPNIHRRDVVAELIGLLETTPPDVVQRSLAALEPASRISQGTDVKGWRAWWEIKSQLSEQAWLEDRMSMYRSRARDLDQENRRIRQQSQERVAALTSRLADLQRDQFRALPVDQRDATLANWLADPLEEVRLSTLVIVGSRITDEGKKPEGVVLEALLKLLLDPSPAVRQEALKLVPHMNHPRLATTMLEQLSAETDVPTRLALLSAMGKLGVAEFIEPLVREMVEPQANRSCVREAALAIAAVAERDAARAELAVAVPALEDQYAKAGEADVALRGALLSAMAAVRSARFTDEFHAALGSDSAEILRPAIVGLGNIEDRTDLTRLRVLVGHTDARVRLAAIQALGRLGRDDADVEPLRQRLNPAVESDTAARDAAWDAFRAILSARPVKDRLAWAEQLREYPGLEVRFLDELVKTLAAANGNGDLLAARDSLARALDAQNQHADAAVQLRELYAAQSANGASGLPETGLRWLRAALRTPGAKDAPDVLTRLAGQATTPEVAEQIIGVVREFLDSQEAAADPNGTRELVQRLHALPLDGLGAGWVDLMTQWNKKLELASPAPGTGASGVPEAEPTPDA